MTGQITKNNLIKAENSSMVTPVPFQFDDIQKLAKVMLQKANAQAQRLLDAARTQAVELEKTAFDAGEQKGHKEGYDKGFQEGLIAGEKAAREELLQRTGTLQPMLEEVLQILSQERLTLKNHAENDLLELSIAIAESIVKQQISLNVGVVLANLQAAIDLTVCRRDLIIYVSSQDCAAVEEYLPQLQKQFSEIERVKLLPDADMTSGGVRIVTAEGEIDVQIEEQLKALKRTLLGELDES